MRSIIGLDTFRLEVDYIQNVGKIFESAIKDSIPDTCWLYRLRDNAASFAGGSNTRFTSNNICDYIAFDDITKTLFLWELKSTQGTSLTFWREDFEVKGKQSSFMIKKNQILGLHEASKHMLCAGFILNFRNKNNDTFFISIDDFLDMTSELNKKSFNIDDLKANNAIPIYSSKARTRYTYNIGKLIKEIHL